MERKRSTISSPITESEALLPCCRIESGGSTRNKIITAHDEVVETVDTSSDVRIVVVCAIAVRTTGSGCVDRIAI
jgi:hypothetical protein